MATEFGPSFIRQAFRVLTGDANKQQREVTLDVLRRVVRATPIDTGVLRRSFTAQTLNKAVHVEPPAEGQTLPTPRHSLRSIPVPGRGRPLYITTGVEYAQYINEGHSQFAPEKYIERAVANAVRAAGRRR